ncbi:MAG: transglycosylase domain-containing protein, partial [Acidobacteriota bacterium]
MDKRRGYTDIPLLARRLRDGGYAITRQARVSRGFAGMADRGLFAIYHEKPQAGLSLADRNGRIIHRSSYPSRVYRTIDEIPDLLVDTVQFVENRHLLDDRFPHRNPAVDWGRLVHAIVALAQGPTAGSRNTPGGSTLATQLEKFRHSPRGRTTSPADKLRQMLSASLRAYRDGERTVETRGRIVRDYVNSVPLGSQAGFGEVLGLGDGLWAYYGVDFASFNRRLRHADPSRSARPSLEEMTSGALAYRQALSLIIAQRRPTYYLKDGRRRLGELTSSYVRLLANEGIISKRFRDLVLASSPIPRARSPRGEHPDFARNKLASTLRAELLSTTGRESLYALDRLDMRVETHIDLQVQDAVLDLLHDLQDRTFVRAHGLDGPHLLAGADPAKIVYAFTLFERTAAANLLRVQADTDDRPFNVNEGVKLDLGSTAKLRTLITYLEIVARLHSEYAGVVPDRLETMDLADADPLTRWAIGYLKRNADRSLATMLQAAMQRQYSASPDETFFTGGGLHHFSNFSHDEDGGHPSVQEAFRRSINL